MKKIFALLLILSFLYSCKKQSLYDDNGWYDNMEVTVYSSNPYSGSITHYDENGNRVNYIEFNNGVGNDFGVTLYNLDNHTWYGYRTRLYLLFENIPNHFKIVLKINGKIKDEREFDNITSIFINIYADKDNIYVN